MGIDGTESLDGTAGLDVNGTVDGTVDLGVERTIDGTAGFDGGRPIDGRCYIDPLQSPPSTESRVLVRQLIGEGRRSKEGNRRKRTGRTETEEGQKGS